MKAKLLSQVLESKLWLCVVVIACACVRVCVCRCCLCYASWGTNTRQQQQQQQAGGRILTRLCLPHTRVWSLGNLPAVNHREATQVGEPSSGLTSGVSAEGDLFQRDTPSAANLKRPPLSERRGNAQGKHIFMSEHLSVHAHVHAPWSHLHVSGQPDRIVTSSYIKLNTLFSISNSICMRIAVVGTFHFCGGSIFFLSLS